jgi:hypothetical protein
LLKKFPVRKGNREHFDKLSASQGTENREQGTKITPHFSVNSVPLWFVIP